MRQTLLHLGLSAMLFAWPGIALGVGAEDLPPWEMTGTVSAVPETPIATESSNAEAAPLDEWLERVPSSSAETKTGIKIPQGRRRLGPIIATCAILLVITSDWVADPPLVNLGQPKGISKSEFLLQVAIEKDQKLLKQQKLLIEQQTAQLKHLNRLREKDAIEQSALLDDNQKIFQELQQVQTDRKKATTAYEAALALSTREAERLEIELAARIAEAARTDQERELETIANELEQDAGKLGRAANARRRSGNAQTGVQHQTGFQITVRQTSTIDDFRPLLEQRLERSRTTRRQYRWNDVAQHEIERYLTQNLNQDLRSFGILEKFDVAPPRETDPRKVWFWYKVLPDGSSTPIGPLTLDSLRGKFRAEPGHWGIRVHGPGMDGPEVARNVRELTQ